MSTDNKRNEELDSILDEIFGETPSTDSRYDLEQRANLRRETSYLNFETDDDFFDEVSADTTVVDVADGEDADDVRLYEGGAPSNYTSDAPTQVINVNEDSQTYDEEEEDEEEDRKQKNKEALGCLKALVYIFLVLLISVVAALFIYKAAVDLTGIGKSTMSIDVTVPEGAVTQDVAELLKEEGVIDEPLFFRVYCRLLKVDGTFHPGVHTVSANMGYDGLVDELQKIELRETVTVTIPEGATIDAIAATLEDNNVCTSKEFYTALVSYNYNDYDFIAELTDDERKDRVYLLEGYLFPDTYDFYVDGAAETVIRTMLDNFATRVNADTRASIKASGKTLNEVLIAASIVQMEAGVSEDMPRVMRVIENRLQNPDNFPRLQMDSTSEYLTQLLPSLNGTQALNTAYDTYVREGLPVGAICNPGLEAINAALNPSKEPDIVNCFYFASIVETKETEFFETFAEHEAWCIEHGVGMYG